MAKLTLSLGSNLGDRTEYLARARRLLTTRIGPIRYASPILETPAWGNTAQPDFLNQVVVIETALPPPLAAALHHLLDTTQAIEQALGRVRTEHWGPRTVDIDIIFIDDLHYTDDRLTVPHPLWQERSFVTDLLPPDPENEVGIDYP